MPGFTEHTREFDKPPSLDSISGWFRAFDARAVSRQQPAKGLAKPQARSVATSGQWPNITSSVPPRVAADALAPGQSWCFRARTNGKSISPSGNSPNNEIAGCLANRCKWKTARQTTETRSGRAFSGEEPPSSKLVRPDRWSTGRSASCYQAERWARFGCRAAVPYTM